jgi:transcriptional regulator with XRE-family HTH domain
VHPQQKQLGKAIKQKRTALGLSQEKLAERANLHWTYVGGVERGERNVSLVNILRLAEALETTASKLLNGIRIGR